MKTGFVTVIKKASAGFFAGAFLCLGVPLLRTGCDQAQPDLNDPQAIYDNYCFACHESGAAGAPRLSQVEFWQAAADQRERLYASTLEGVRAMPRKGTCLTCTDKQLKQVVDWMIKQSTMPAPSEKQP